jgi:hypothetical protein
MEASGKHEAGLLYILILFPGLFVVEDLFGMTGLHYPTFYGFLILSITIGFYIFIGAVIGYIIQYVVRKTKR